MPFHASPILGGFSQTKSRNAADNEIINLGVEIIETKDGTHGPGFLFGMSGLVLAASIGPGPIRGMKRMGELLYIVSGNLFYSMSANKTFTLLGTVSPGTGNVSMITNGHQLVLFDGVGAWLVPGGLPLTGGSLSTLSSGSLYNPGDQVTLKASSGNQYAQPIIQIETTANLPVAIYSLANLGSAYTTTSNAPTTPIQPQMGTGSGLTLNITASGGAITSATIASGGTQYAVGDTGTISGVYQAIGVYYVTSVSAGVVTGFILLNRGYGYNTASGVATTASLAMPSNAGIGFTINITASGGPIASSSLQNPGHGYVAGNVGFIATGSGDATYVIVETGENGAVLTFSIISGGAIDTPPVSFSQISTTGSGSGLTIINPTFGPYSAMIPLTLPFPSPQIGTVSDGFGVAMFLNSQNIAASNELDLSTWNALSFGVADQSPDTCVAISTFHDEVFIFKTKSTEVWADQGLSPFPFGPLQGVHIEWGCAAPFSVVTCGEEQIWLSRNAQGQGVFVKARAYVPAPCSTQAVTNAIQQYSDIGDCIAYSRQEGGHLYYVATFPSGNVTWVYDLTSSELAGYPIWTKIAAVNNGAINRHWGNCWETFQVSGVAGTGLLGDYLTGNMYNFSPDAYLDNNQPRLWLRRWRAMVEDGSQARAYYSLFVAMESGAGVPPGQTSNLMLRWSDDGGNSWSDYRILPFNNEGQTSANAKFNRLGSTGRFSEANRIFELSSTDPFKVTILDAEVDVAL